jgi:hypothetical protein
MAKHINKTQEVLTKLKAESKVTVMNTAADVASIAAFDKRMETVRREYQIKEKNSQVTAAKVILTS